MKKLLIGCFLSVCTFVVLGQQTNTYTDSENLFYEGKALHSQKKYAASTISLEKYLKSADKRQSETVQESEYFLAANAFELHKIDAIYKLKAYIKEYPYSSFLDQSYFMIATIEFEQRNFKEAIVWFKKISAEKLSPEDNIDYLFRYAYTQLQLKDYAASKYLFSQLKGKNTRYEDAVNYYYAYTEYTQKNYDTALAGFLKVEENSEYAGFVPYYIVQIYYQKKKYEELIPIAEGLVKKNPNNENNAEVYRILGECYYQKKDYEKTIANLGKYQQIVKKVVRNDMYLLGISYYNVKKYKDAVTYLSKVPTDSDEISQNAYLHLGISYLKLDQKNNARLAFEPASKMNFDKDVKEEALYNYALATYELSFSPFNESVLAFEAFLKEFPKSKYTDKVYDYLVNVYLTTKNYQEAYESMLKIQNPSPRIQEAKQRVLFNMGVDVFNSANYDKAIELFTNSLSLGTYNPTIAARARYWRADCFYRQEKYGLAREDYNAFLLSPGARLTKEFNLANYNIGYSYFNEKDYNSALPCFRKYIAFESNKSLQTYTDALNRTGDCYFTQHEFGNAQKYYNEAADAKSTGGDYSIFQKAFVMGLQKDYSGEINTLQGLLRDFPNSTYKADALSEIGHAYALQEKMNEAVATYDELYKEFPTSSFARKGLLEKGMLYFNANQSENAITAYKQVVSTYPNSEEATTALESLEKLYVQTNNVSEYTTYVQTLGNSIKISTEKEDSLNYAAAERQYLYGKVPQAAENLDLYLQKYPDGKFNIKARYYLAECLYAKGEKAQALDEYKKLIQQKGNPFMEESVARAGEISYDEKNYDDAIQYFNTLKSISEKKENIAAARLGILRCNDFLNNATGTIAAANEMMEDARLDVELVREARYRRAKAYLSLNEGEKALNDLTELSYETRNIYGAECNYLLANYYFTINSDDAAQKVIFNFIDKNTPHQYWLARCFILLSDIYIKKGDDFQAKQYLLSLKENYKQADAIQDMIKERLDKIEQRERDKVITTVSEEK
jgi:TolA-binding protein